MLGLLSPTKFVDHRILTLFYFVRNRLEINTETTNQGTQSPTNKALFNVNTRDNCVCGFIDKSARCDIIKSKNISIETQFSVNTFLVLTENRVSTSLQQIPPLPPLNVSSLIQ